MSDRSMSPPDAPASIPPDDQKRKLTVANPDDARVAHVFVAGDTYSILVPGSATGGRFCLIDMLVPDGGGPPPTGTISKRPFRCSRASSNSPFAAKRKP